MLNLQLFTPAMKREAKTDPHLTFYTHAFLYEPSEGFFAEIPGQENEHLKVAPLFSDKPFFGALLPRKNSN